MFVEVSGTGKTATIAKIVHRLKKKNISSVIAASDTFRAGAILQDQLGDHKAAATMFESYISRRRPMRAEAMVRLSRSAAVLGQTARAEALLRQVLQNYSGNSAARKAKKQLDGLHGNAD